MLPLLQTKNNITRRSLQVSPVRQFLTKMDHLLVRVYSGSWSALVLWVHTSLGTRGLEIGWLPLLFGVFVNGRFSWSEQVSKNVNQDYICYPAEVALSFFLFRSLLCFASLQKASVLQKLSSHTLNYIYVILNTLVF